MGHVAESVKQEERPQDRAFRHREAAPSKHPILQLQQRAGNQAVQRLLRGGLIQAKLAVSQPNDPQEREADQVADRVMRSHAGAPIGSSCSCAAGSDMCEECQQKQTGAVARKSLGTDARPAAHGALDHVLHSPGRPLDSEVRTYLEPRFGHDFSAVRVHTGREAEHSAQAINARAYTSGNHIVFGSSQYQPSSSDGRRLLAHELTHVVQQLSRPAYPVIQRDLATPPPAAPAKPQPDLTPAQITEAINFNRARFDAQNTKTIQSLLGGSNPPTGVWTGEDIVAIASTQEEYGLFKDGKVGNQTLRFIDREQTLEKADTSTENCLTSFVLIGPGVANFGRDDATHCHFGNQFDMEAQFSPRCNCDQFQYRQFISGHYRRTRAGVVTDLPIREAGGVLLDAFTEDADTSDPTALNYGHREQAVDPMVENHYIDAAGADDQAHGCRYRGHDSPGNGNLGDCLPGDRYDLLARFRGEIQRNGRPIQTKFWTGFDIRNWNP
jgi:hypothetical protein